MTTTTARPLNLADPSQLDSPVLQMVDVSKQFHSRTAVNHLDLDVQAGEVLGLLGHNGAGKTTTVRLLTGLLAPSSGTIRVFGRSPTADGPAVRARIGMVGAATGLDPRLTGSENLAIFAALYDLPPGTIPGRIAALLTEFGLADRAADRVAGYSTGMRQRLALARALIHKPHLLLLDEPTTGLDPVATRQVHALIVQLRDEGRTVLLATHNLEEAQRLCDRVAVLRQGQLLAIGTPAELVQRIAPRGRLEIEVETGAADTARAVIGATLGGAKEMRTSGTTLSVGDMPRSGIPELVAALVGAGVPIVRVTPEAATLADVYFSLHPPGEA